MRRPFDGAQGGAGHRVLCGELRRAKAAGVGMWALKGSTHSYSTFVCIADAWSIYCAETLSPHASWPQRDRIRGVRLVLIT
jgi:hypothetical protein